MLSSSLISILQVAVLCYILQKYYHLNKNRTVFSKTCYHSIFQDSEMSCDSITSAPDYARRQCYSYRFQEVRKCDIRLFRDDSIICMIFGQFESWNVQLTHSPTHTRAEAVCLIILRVGFFLKECPLKGR